MDNKQQQKSMPPEKSKNGGVAEEAKQKVLDSLSKIKEEDKLNFLVNRLVQHEIDSSKAKSDTQQLEVQTKRAALLDKQVAMLQGMLTKTELSKSKLEELCRELNKANKEISEKNTQRLRLLEENHRNTVENLKASLGDIQKTVNDKREHTQRVADVEQLSTSLKDLSSEYEKRLNDLKNLYEEREGSLETISKNKDDEINILKTELKSMHERVQQVFTENVNLKKQLIENDTKMKTALESEIEMRKLLNDYATKYQNLLSSLANSNESFDRVKKEMTKMNGSLIKMEGESRKWRQRFDESKEQVSKLCAKLSENEKQLAAKETKLVQLKDLNQQLCHRLKSEKPSKPAVESLEDGAAKTETDVNQENEDKTSSS
uniref:Alpha-taxilin n=1 Tax=Panagrolaimus sp. ES5 TaxID=591445 RepID=A0AC34F5D3_9BILA